MPGWGGGFIVAEGSEIVWMLNVERYLRNRRSSTQMGVGWGYGYSCHHFGSTRSRPDNKQTDAKPKTDLFVDSRLADVLTKRSSAFRKTLR